MTFSNLFKTAFGFLQTGTAKSSSVKNAEEIIQAVESGILESAQSALENQASAEGLWMTEAEQKKKLVDWKL